MPAIAASGASLLTAFGLSACSFACLTDHVRTLRAPDSQHVAAVFRQECEGATGHFQTTVSVVAPADTGRGLSAGEVFIIEDSTFYNAARYDSIMRVDAEWLNAHLLRISYDPRADVLSQRTERSSISVVYQTRPNPTPPTR